MSLRVTRLSLMLLLLGLLVPARPAIAAVDTLVYLESNASDRYLVTIDESGSRRVLADIDAITAPAVSPDGSRIAFSGALGNESLGQFAIFIVNSDGSGLTQVTGGSEGEFDPAWSPDGESIVFSRNATGSLSESTCCQLVSKRLSNGTETVLTAVIGAVRPAYSPDGSFVVYDTPSGVWRVPSVGGSAMNLAPPGGFGPAVSPDGAEVAYQVDTAAGAAIRKVGSAGGVPTEIYSTSSHIEDLAWSGGKVFFTEFSGEGYDGRASVEYRSVAETGGTVVVERGFSSTVVGVVRGVADAASFVVGDATADNLDDIHQIGPGARILLESKGADFDPVEWGVVTPPSGWSRHLAGDFDGDGTGDVASFLRSDGSWTVALSDGNQYDVGVWADYSTASGWEAQSSGDFTGDGRSDVANFHPSNGTWWVSRSTGFGVCYFSLG